MLIIKSYNYGMIWYDSTRLYAVVWYSNAMVWEYNAMAWYSNAMEWDINDMLWYGVCWKIYA